MKNDNVSKVLVIILFIVSIGTYVAFRSGFFKSQKENSQVESVIDDNSILLDSVTDDSRKTFLEVLPDSTLRYMSSSKVIRVLDDGDVRISLERYYENLDEDDSIEKLKKAIRELIIERDRLNKSAKPNNPIIINLNQQIKQHKEILQKIDSLKASENE